MNPEASTLATAIQAGAIRIRKEGTCVFNELDTKWKLEEFIE